MSHVEENILEIISKLEKEKSALLDQKEQLQSRARIANKRSQDIQSRIQEMSAYKAEKESDLVLVKARVDTRQGHFDDLKVKISQCRADIQRNQEALTLQSDRQFELIGNLEEAVLGLSEKFSSNCAININTPTGFNEEMEALGQQIKVRHRAPVFLFLNSTVRPLRRSTLS